MEQQQGKILKAVSGFYYVETPEGLMECRARGKFRRQGISPAAGDQAVVSLQGEGKGELEEILPRKNYLVRPPLANLDRLFIVSSVRDPSPNWFVIDKMTAVAFCKGIEPVVVFTKADLGDCAQALELYRRAGIQALRCSSEEPESEEELRALLRDKVSAFTGNTGVGKSSLLNRLFPHLSIATGEISRKLGRGRHTTRHSELYPLPDGGYAADTPGFSTVDMERYETIEEEALISCFPEMEPLAGDCRFTGCSHRVEKGCAVLKAVQNGDIAPSRHESYCRLLTEIRSKNSY